MLYKTWATFRCINFRQAHNKWCIQKHNPNWSNQVFPRTEQQHIINVTVWFQVAILKVAYAHYGKHVVPWLSIAFLRHQFICRRTSLSPHMLFFSMTMNFLYLCQQFVRLKCHGSLPEPSYSPELSSPSYTRMVWEPNQPGYCFGNFTDVQIPTPFVNFTSLS